MNNNDTAIEIALADRLGGIGEYYFSQKLREIDSLNKQGKNIINLGIGSPDLPPHHSVIEVLQTESAKHNTHAYQNYKGSPILRTAISNWYSKWYGVTVNAETEVLPLIGSKEGIMHICMTYFQQGDVVLIPNPGYPTYSAAVKLSGASPLSYSLTEANEWQPSIAEIEALIQSSITKNQKVKGIFLNYPHMPTGQLPNIKILEQLIALAKKYQCIIIHDNPYSFILNKTPMSMLSIAGAKEVVLELNSLSKSQNMAGWRVGMLVANETRINEVLRFKSNMDSGMFLPLQLAAAKALSLDKDWYDYVNEVYESRRKKVFELLDVLKCSYSKDQVGMFVWAKAN
ncbi:MAG: pyridoxal phosphate-dependent aminotransferase, partial [Chitinophagaceae bacterium]